MSIITKPPVRRLSDHEANAIVRIAALSIENDRLRTENAILRDRPMAEAIAQTEAVLLVAELSATKAALVDSTAEVVKLDNWLTDARGVEKGLRKQIAALETQFDDMEGCIEDLKSENAELGRQHNFMVEHCRAMQAEDCSHNFAFPIWDDAKGMFRADK
jgi:predicted RNase H-like nuclease (RuvC/YqgF family)